MFSLPIRSTSMKSEALDFHHVMILLTLPIQENLKLDFAWCKKSITFRYSRKTEISLREGAYLSCLNPRDYTG